METVKTLMTYVVALVVILGGGVLLVVPSQVAPEQLLPFLTAMIGAVIAFVFGERQTHSAQQGVNGFADRAAVAALTTRLDSAGIPAAAAK